MGQIGIEGYENLGNAVIIQAVHDYRKAYGKYLNGRKDKNTLDRIRELEEFFTGEWIQVLTSLDGTMILKTIRKEEEAVQEGKMKRRSIVHKTYNRKAH